MTMTTSRLEPIPRAVWRIAVVIVFGAFMAGLDTSLVNVGIDTIAHQLHGTLPDTQWISSGYLLALAAVLPACPWLTRRFRGKRVWLTALVIFTVASLSCALSTALPTLIVSRLAQGAAGGLLVPAGQTILARAAGPGRMGRVMSTAGIAVVLAPAIGPAIGGVLIAHLSWQWLFIVNAPIGVAAFILGARILPAEERAAPENLDVLGLLLLSIGLPLVTYGIITLGSPERNNAVLATASATMGFGLLTAFIVRSVLARRRKSNATRILDVGLFAKPTYSAAQVTVLLTGASLFGGLVVLPLYYEVLRGESAQNTGLLLLAYGFGAAAALRLGGILTDRIGGGLSCVLGLIVTISATVPFVYLPADANLLLVETLQALRGIGVGLAGLPAMSSAFSAAGPNIADATTTSNIVQRLGGSIGSALLVTALATTDKSDPVVPFHMVFGWLTIGAAAALVSAIWLAVAQRAHTTVTTPTSDYSEITKSLEN
jgi:EmrB/QacA subfamily drug resistance transporter